MALNLAAQYADDPKRFDRMQPITMTQLVLREMGYVGDVVERVIAQRFRRDWLGFADWLGFHPDFGWLAVQATTSGEFSRRKQKIVGMLRNHQRIYDYLRAGHRAQIWGWRPVKRRREDWNVRREEVSLQWIHLNGNG